MTPEELVAALEAEVAAKQAELDAAQAAIITATEVAGAVQAELDAKLVELAAAVAAASIPAPLIGNLTALLPWLMVGGAALYCLADCTFALIRKSDSKVVDAPGTAGSIAELLEGAFGAASYAATVTGNTLTITGSAGTGPINISAIGVKHHSSSIATFINVA